MVNVLEGYEPTTNGAEEIISFEQPYVARVTVEGACPILFHGWNNASVEEKSKAAKGSKAKKTDDVESYVYRLDDKTLAIPSTYFCGSISYAAKYRQDPRSPRKSAYDLFRAGVVGLEDLCSLGVKNWDYIDQRRVTVQRNGITRSRPAFRTGWQVEVPLVVLLPEYIPPQVLNDVLQQAGRLIGVGDFRPTFGRFRILHFEVSEA